MIYIFLLLTEGVNYPCLNSTPMSNTTKQAMNLQHKEFSKCSASAQQKRDCLKCTSAKILQKECKLFEV